MLIILVRILFRKFQRIMPLIFPFCCGWLESYLESFKVDNRSDSNFTIPGLESYLESFKVSRPGS